MLFYIKQSLYTFSEKKLLSCSVALGIQECKSDRESPIFPSIEANISWRVYPLDVCQSTLVTHNVSPPPCVSIYITFALFKTNPGNTPGSMTLNPCNVKGGGAGKIYQM